MVLSESDQAQTIQIASLHQETSCWPTLGSWTCRHDSDSAPAPVSRWHSHTSAHANVCLRKRRDSKEGRGVEIGGELGERVGCLLRMRQRQMSGCASKKKEGTCMHVWRHEIREEAIGGGTEGAYQILFWGSRSAGPVMVLCDGRCRFVCTCECVGVCVRLWV